MSSLLFQLPFNSIPSLCHRCAFPMWNPNQAHEDGNDDDSWEIRAFAEDTSNIMGTTWPPRFYTCTFCGREFKSAQALGGHMNVHRRDRVRFHQTQPNSIQPISSSATEVIYNGGGVCFFYQIPNNDMNTDFLNSIASSSACRLLSPSATPHPSNSPTESSVRSLKSPGGLSSSSHGSHISSKGDVGSFISMEDGDEKVDLELRLGQRPSSA